MRDVVVVVEVVVGVVVRATDNVGRVVGAIERVGAIVVRRGGGGGGEGGCGQTTPGMATIASHVGLRAKMRDWSMDAVHASSPTRDGRENVVL
jgi:hypothetical protein